MRVPGHDPRGQPSVRQIPVLRRSAVQASPGLDKQLEQVGSTFVSRAVQGSWVIQVVDLGTVTTPTTRRVISISMGLSFGGLTFQYRDVTHEVIQLYAEKRGIDSWAYFEVGSDRPVDFANPFGAPWAEGTGCT
jgi:hypothetical protein